MIQKITEKYKSNRMKTNYCSEEQSGSMQKWTFFLGAREPDPLESYFTDGPIHDRFYALYQY